MIQDKSVAIRFLQKTEFQVVNWNAVSLRAPAALETRRKQRLLQINQVEIETPQTLEMLQWRANQFCNCSVEQRPRLMLSLNEHIKMLDLNSISWF